MYFVPLSQLESVELLIHCLRAAAGQADCTMCPAYKVCTHQCLLIAKSVEQMFQDGDLPQISGGSQEEAISPDGESDPPKNNGGGSAGKGGLRVVK